jgi:hypothetical protein
MKWCKCMEARGFRDAIADLFSAQLVDGKRRGEIWELFEVKSFDEFCDEASDIAWGIGRLLAGCFGKVYWRIPGDRRHYSKVASRMNEYGCTRSKRFLIDGKCPSK